MKALKNARWWMDKHYYHAHDRNAWRLHVAPWEVFLECINPDGVEWMTGIKHASKHGRLTEFFTAPSLRAAKVKARAMFDARDEVVERGE